MILISTTGVRIVESNGQRFVLDSLKLTVMATADALAPLARLAQLNLKSAAKLFLGGIHAGAEYKLGTLNIRVRPCACTPSQVAADMSCRSLSLRLRHPSASRPVPKPELRLRQPPRVQHLH